MVFLERRRRLGSSAPSSTSFSACFSFIFILVTSLPPYLCRGEAREVVSNVGLCACM